MSHAGDLRVGGLLRSFSLPALETDGTVTYEGFRDRPLVLNFFASWCPYCIAEMPGFEQVHRELGSRVAFLGVSQMDRRDLSRDLVRRTGVTYPTAVDAQGDLFRAFGGFSMPVTVFIAPGGRGMDVHTGQIDPPDLLRFIASYFGDQYTRRAA